MNIRNIHWLGSDWKYIAGNSDHDDLVMIDEDLNKLIDNNNQHVIVYKHLEDTIKCTHALTNSTHKSSPANIEMVINLQGLNFCKKKLFILICHSS